MARKPRNSPKSEFQHLTNRGASRNNIYGDNLDRDLFLEYVTKAHAKFNFWIHAFALMGNHYHIVAQFPDRNMSQVMHWLGMCYATAVNRRYGLDGRLCKDRYFNSPIENDPYLLQAVRYVHRNPLDIGVTDLTTYEWSSYASYLQKAATPHWLRTDLVLGMFGNNLTSFQSFNDSTPGDDFRAGGSIAS